MKNILIHSILIILFAACSDFAQSGRSEVNKGVDEYSKEKYADAEINFKKGLEKAPDSFEANFDLGDAYYKQGKFDEAVKSFQSALGSATNNERKAQVYHNIGNSLLKSQKIKESIEAYKNALKYNPNDQETKYNLSYALSMLNQNKNQQQQNQNNKDQNNKDKQNKQNQNQQDKKDKQQNKNENQRNQNQQNKPDQQNQPSKQDNLKQKENKISKKEAERILDALKNNEKDIQKKLRKKTGKVVKTDKDW